MARYAMKANVTGSMDEVKPKLLGALKAQGFGILTEIDVQKTMKAKLGVDFEPYLILGACNPQLAYRALEADRSLGILLPCNIVLRQMDGEVEVSIGDPEVLFEVADAETASKLVGLPGEVRSRLAAVLASMADA